MPQQEQRSATSNMHTKYAYIFCPQNIETSNSGMNYTSRYIALFKIPYPRSYQY